MFIVVLTCTLAMLPVLPPVKLTTLLSSCVDACERGCAEIRAVQAARDRGVALTVDLKAADDPRSALTEADTRAQAAIVGALRAQWPGLCIVGEEDDQQGAATGAAAAAGSPPPLRLDLLGVTSDASVPLADIVVYVDPVDGTREFVEGRLRSCQSLVGVAVRGVAVAGAIGLPFPMGNLSGDTSVVYGLVGAGTGTHGAVRRHPKRGAARPLVAAGDSTHPALRRAVEVALDGDGSFVLRGGAGNKALAAAEGDVDCAIMHTFGGPWDTCAPEAVVKVRH